MISDTFTRHEKRFLWAAAVGTAVCVFLAVGAAVPFSGVGSAAGTSPVPLLQAARVDLNLAGPDALCTLPGIGEKKAQALVAYRLQNGPFQCVEDAAAVPGITPELVESWQGLAYVS